MKNWAGEFKMVFDCALEKVSAAPSIPNVPPPSFWNYSIVFAIISYYISENSSPLITDGAGECQLGMTLEKLDPLITIKERNFLSSIILRDQIIYTTCVNNLSSSHFCFLPILYVIQLVSLPLFECMCRFDVDLGMLSDCGVVVCWDPQKSLELFRNWRTFQPRFLVLQSRYTCIFLNCIRSPHNTYEIWGALKSARIDFTCTHLTRLSSIYPLHRNAFFIFSSQINVKIRGLGRYEAIWSAWVVIWKTSNNLRIFRTT